MNKTLLLAGVACLFSFSANAAELNPYVSGKLIYSDVGVDATDSWRTGSRPGSDKSNFDNDVWGMSVAGGVSMPTIGGALRTELELNIKEDGKKSNGGNRAEIENNSLMINAYYDIDTGTKFTPYVGGGIGYAHLKGTVNSRLGKMSESSNEFAWNVGAGIAYAVNENIAIDLGYRYSDFGSIEKEYLPGREFKADIDASEFLLGARYSF